MKIRKIALQNNVFLEIKSLILQIIMERYTIILFWLAKMEVEKHNY